MTISWRDPLKLPRIYQVVFCEHSIAESAKISSVYYE